MPKPRLMSAIVKMAQERRPVIAAASPPPPPEEEELEEELEEESEEEPEETTPEEPEVDREAVLRELEEADARRAEVEARQAQEQAEERLTKEQRKAARLAEKERLRRGGPPPPYEEVVAKMTASQLKDEISHHRKKLDFVPIHRASMESVFRDSMAGLDAQAKELEGKIAMCEALLKER